MKSLLRISEGLLVVPAVLACAVQALAGSAPVFFKPPMPSAEILRRWGDSVEARILEAQEVRRRGLPLFLNYPGQRAVFNNVPPGIYDVTRVDADVYLDLDTNGFVAVETRMTLVPLANNVKYLKFFLAVPELVEATSLKPDVPIDAKLTGEVVEVTYPSPLPIEEEVVLVLRYQGKVNCQVRFMMPTCELGANWKYMTHSQFLPLESDFQDMFVGTMRLYLSGQGYEKWHGGGTGTFVGSRLLPEKEMKELTFEHVFPTNLYAFSVSKLGTVHGWAGDIPISATVPKDKVKNASVVLGIMQDVLDYYSSIYVGYPWDKLDAVAMPNSFSGGFGPLSTIFVMKSTFDAIPGDTSLYRAMQLISHEIGHQWWGNLVEMADGTAVVLSEGLAEFSSDLFFQHVTGSRWAFVSNNMSYIYTTPHDEEPYLIAPFVSISPYYYQVAYQKGAVVFDMLRLELGDEVLLAGLAELATRFYQQYATPQDLLEALEDVSGKDLGYFYERWFKGKGIIEATISGDCRPGRAACIIRLSQKGEMEGKGPFSFNLPVYVEKVDGSSEVVTVRIEGWEQEVEIPVAPENVYRLVADPYRQLLRVWRPGLPGDLDNSGLVDGADLVEMSFAYQMNIVYDGDWGEYFIPNYYYNELADLAADEGPGEMDGRVNQLDLDVFYTQVGKSNDE